MYSALLRFNKITQALALAPWRFYFFLLLGADDQFIQLTGPFHFRILLVSGRLPYFKQGLCIGPPPPPPGVSNSFIQFPGWAISRPRSNRKEIPWGPNYPPITFRGKAVLRVCALTSTLIVPFLPRSLRVENFYFLVI